MCISCRKNVNIRCNLILISGYTSIHQKKYISRYTIWGEHVKIMSNYQKGIFTLYAIKTVFQRENVWNQSRSWSKPRLYPFLIRYCIHPWVINRHEVNYIKLIIKVMICQQQNTAGIMHTYLVRLQPSCVRRSWKGQESFSLKNELLKVSVYQVSISFNNLL